MRPLGGHVGDGALQHLEQGLLHPLTGHVAGDRGVFALAGDLVDLVDVDDAPLGLFDIQIRLLEQAQQDVLDVLAHVARFGQGGGIGHGEGHIEHLRQGLGQEGFAAAGGPDQQDVRFVQAGGGLVRLALAVPLPGQALVVVVDGYGEHLFGLLLTHDLLVEEGLDLLGPGDGGESGGGLGRFLRRGLAAAIGHGPARGPWPWCSTSSSSRISLQRSMHSSQM